MIYLSSWMYEESDLDGGLYAQVGGNATTASKKLIYWRSVMVFFAMASQHTRHRADVRLLLFTNVQILPEVNGVHLKEFLESLRVEVVYLQYQWRPRFPSKAWYNQFYVFDIMDYFEVRGRIEDYFIVADSDCIAVENLDAMFSRLVEDQYLVIDVVTKSDEDINGITRQRAASVYGSIGAVKQPLVAPYFGGEFFAISGQLLGIALAFSRDAFELNNRRADLRLPYLTEEAHLLSYVFVQLGVTESNADRYVRRIWTSWKSNNTSSDDLGLAMWHVPIEKIFGLKTLSKRMSSQYRKTKAIPRYTKAELSFHLGIGKWRFKKMAYTFLYAALRRLIQKLMSYK